MCSSVPAAVELVLGSVVGAGEEVLALVELIDQAQAALAERVGAFDAAEGWAADGAYSFACWLRARADVSRSESLQLGRFARSLRTMPLTEAAVRDGTISVVKARLLVGVVNERTAERFLEHEAFLVDQLRRLSVDDAKAAADYWKRLADTDGADPSDPTRNWASLTPGYQGRWHLEADLDQASGTVLKAVLDAMVHRMHQDGRFADLEGDGNTAGRRTAEALVEVANRACDATPGRPAVHPDVVVVVPQAALVDEQPDPSNPPTIIGAGPATVADALRLALLGTVSVLTTDEAGRPLNLSRKVRLATHDQWIAITVRDRGCVAPGCDRAAAWCQAHHLRWWRHGGSTDLANLALVCSHHHHLIHGGGWIIQPDAGGRWHLTRPDGMAVEPPRYAA